MPRKLEFDSGEFRHFEKGELGGQYQTKQTEKNTNGSRNEFNEPVSDSLPAVFVADLICFFDEERLEK